ncbi:winged helix-turn-helix domain-containing protein [Intestinirhabdus alba]|jgi:DNA-binding winged helix-turn-helix (wHTH) protein|uniref:Transcriptional regulator n=1 Tax=Intestinirhabdus alba TaxID=2899544 RepID=A0A6L6IG04_9ENTR|nr:transcriptional regulator [Intestinirhabdus alba]MTH45569.1 transcriptional regulator [Intestinirhabdus alba]
MSDENIFFSLDQGVRFLPELRCIITATGSTISLSENSYRFLLLLLQGETDKQNIINQVWREQRGSVSDSSYYGQIYMLRKALDMAGLPGSLIKTIPRKGVKYMGKIEKHSSDISKNTEVRSADIHMFELEERLSDSTEGELQTLIDHDDTHIEWYKTKQWNLFISILAALAMCWLITLIVMLFILLH